MDSRYSPFEVFQFVIDMLQRIDTFATIIVNEGHIFLRLSHEYIKLLKFGTY